MSFFFGKKNNESKKLISIDNDEQKRNRTLYAINSTPKEILDRTFMIKRPLEVEVYIGSMNRESRELFVASMLYSEDFVKQISKYQCGKSILMFESNGFASVFVVPISSGSNSEKTLLSIFSKSSEMPIFTEISSNIAKCPYMYKELLKEGNPSF